MRKLAHSKAETEGDLFAWSAAEVVEFKKSAVTPAKNGTDLLRVVLAVLSNIASSFCHAVDFR